MSVESGAPGRDGSGHSLRFVPINSRVTPRRKSCNFSDGEMRELMQVVNGFCSLSLLRFSLVNADFSSKDRRDLSILWLTMKLDEAQSRGVVLPPFPVVEISLAELASASN